ncbi:OmpA family protein [Arenibacter troitsensis]|uniref:WD40-like Beta Propeller Repeat n=1 Tax=Arenibacter troitsensis TaxID=188872 RepID=A0A1X7K4I2_9FLAO|nr:OmpA family protein [Arenibacter troitsensis]SMG35704.1 WD40-like Beta Propeller Repeat [Arenibacter troitsensis]
MIKRFFLLTVLFSVLGNVIIAQDRLINKADEKYQDYSFSPAIDIYKRVLDKGYTSADLLMKLGNSYYFNAEYKEASDIYKRLLNEYKEGIGPEYYFRYAQTLRSLGEYDMSKDVMAEFSRITSADVRANLYMAERDYLAEIEKNSGRYEIGKFAFNSRYSDFAPSFYGQGLIFSSDRDTGNLARYRHTWNSKDFLDLYKVNADSVSENKVVKFGDNINTRYHESTSVFTKDGNTLYFTRNNLFDGKTVKDEKGVVRLKIFKAIKENGIWTQIEELPFNSESYSIAHPTLSPDEKILYFASDMPGSYGESDIFKVAINSDGTYGTPVNLGNIINTEARETFPYVTSENVLYFSSDGHPGLGGLDIFATKISNSQYIGTVLNVGKPVNSELDDFTFIINEETRNGYFASNRENGVGQDDIYSFVETKKLEFDCIKPITGTVRDKISNQVLVGATVKVIDENNEELASSITDSNGNYSITIDCNKGNFVRATMQGYVPSEEYLNISDSKPLIVDFYLERDTVTAGYGDDLAKLLQLSTIYFDFDRFNVRPDAEIEIQKVIAAMEKYPSLKLKVTSHTDSQGVDAYNLWLSQKRAESTVAYMVSKGIASDRLQGEGFGETRLVNRCGNGIKCSKAEHQMNRRSEFLILE